VAADLVVVCHLLFVMFVVFGGLIAIFRPRLMWLHLPAVAWGVIIEFSGGTCPLTPLENELRRRQGLSGYEGDFVAHYILLTLYPEGLTRTIQICLGLTAIVFNAIIYAFLWKRKVATRD
jgi:hypothetical protein